MASPKLHTLVSSPHDRRSLFSPRSLVEASSHCGRRIGIIKGERHRISRFSLFFSLFFLLLWLIPLDSGWRWSKSTITERFRVVMGWKQPQLMVPPGMVGTHRYFRPW
ncbi:hypothetical protein BHM03_00020400 [Ensete ventricosum]|nr:hypothetical protein BHM03_00020400 [Ensete ventricosum]